MTGDSADDQGALVARLRALRRDAALAQGEAASMIRTLRRADAPGWHRRHRSLTVAVGLACFLVGVATGGWFATRNSLEQVVVGQTTDPVEAAVVLQRAGTLYVTALVRLRHATQGHPASGSPEGIAVATAVTRAALSTYARFIQDDRLAVAAWRLLADPSATAASEAPRLLWF